MTQDDLLLALVDRWLAIAQECRKMAVDDAREDHKAALCVAAVNREECAKELAATIARTDDEYGTRGRQRDGAPPQPATRRSDG
jgi:hypothetical protein